jgi:hypothetical protein
VELSGSDKVAVLLNLQDMQVKEMHRREETEQKLFEWSTSLLLTALAAIVALSQRSAALPQATFVKVIATVMVGVPVYLTAVKIKEQSGASVGNAEAVERIQNLLHLFDDAYYGDHSPYPQEWAGKLAKGRLNRKSPIQKSVIIVLMAVCVISAIWTIL